MSWSDIQKRHGFSYGSVMEDPDGNTVTAQEWVYNTSTDSFTIHCTINDTGKFIMWPAERLKKASVQKVLDTHLQSVKLKDPLEEQVGGTHYKTMRLQPIEACYQRYGLPGVKAAVHVKVDKYLGRNKGNPIEDIDKAIHCLELLKEFYRKERENG